MLRMWMLSIIARSQQSSSHCRAALLPMSSEQQHRGVMLQVALHMLFLRMSIATASQKGTSSSTAASLPRRQHPFRATLRLQNPGQQSTTHHRHSIELSWMV